MNDIGAIVKSVENVDLSVWSDDRRKEFTNTFEARVLASRFILVQTARTVLSQARQRHFVSARKADAVNFPSVQPSDHYRNSYGGRARKELIEIASEKAQKLLKELPPLQKAMLVLNPEVAKMIDERDTLQAKCQRAYDALEKLSEEKSLADFDQSMTVGQLRQHLKEVAAKRKRLVQEIDELSSEGYALSVQIDKATAAGVPGISEAVLKIVNQMCDKATALDQISRRVHEKVMFGDSKEALEILKSFEQDEAEVGEIVHKQLREAVAALGVSVRTKKGGRK